MIFVALCGDRFRCSGLGVQGKGQRVEEVTETGRQVALGIEPLLDHLREDHKFVEVCCGHSFGIFGIWCLTC